MTGAHHAARAAVRVERSPGGALRYAELRSSPLAVLRPTPQGLYVVSGMATPLGGDHLDLDLVLGDGAELTVRSAGAAVARRGPHGRSVSRVNADVGTGATLRWQPEPAVAAAGCCHQSESRVRLGPGATVVWRDSVVVGRIGEEPGDWASALHVDGRGGPVLRTELRVGPGAPGWDGPAVGGAGRALGSVLVAGEDLPALTAGAVHVASDAGHAVATQLAGGGVLVSVVSAGHPDLITMVDALCCLLPDDIARLLRSGDQAGHIPEPAIATRRFKHP